MMGTRVRSTLQSPKVLRPLRTRPDPKSRESGRGVDFGRGARRLWRLARLSALSWFAVVPQRAVKVPPRLLREPL